MDYPSIKTNWDRYHRLVPKDYKQGGGLNPHSAAIWASLLGLQQKAGIRGDFLEIGVWRGMAQAMLAMYRKNDEVLVSVDPFMTKEKILPILQSADPQIEPHIEFLQVDSCKSDTPRILQNRNREFRFVHIDGEHSYEAVVNDLYLASACLARGGVVAVDDYFFYESPSITRAVLDFTRSNHGKLVILFVAFNKAYLCHPRDYSFYMPWLLRLTDLLEEVDLQTTVGTSEYSLAPGALSVFHRRGGKKYQVVMKRVETLSKMLDWAGLSTNPT